jgi:hypothetical protein
MPLIPTTAELQMSDEDRKKLEAIALEALLESDDGDEKWSITSARDAADVSAAVLAAVSKGDITLGEASEIGKLIDCFMKAYRTAELDAGGARIEQLTDEELLMLLADARAREAAPALPAQKLLVLNRG